MIPPVAASDPTYRDNGSEYFTHDEVMIDRGSIISGPITYRGAHARMSMLISPGSAQFIISGTWRKLTRTQKWYLPSTQRTGPRLRKQWKSTLEDLEEYMYNLSVTC